MPSLLIINADDFGLSKSVNYGIVDAHRYGVVTSTTAMMNMQNIQHAAELAIQVPTLAIGMHFVLTTGTPLTVMPTLTREGKLGKWLWELEAEGQLPLDEIMAELNAQYQRFNDVFGRPPSHIDSHHHIHMIAQLFPLIAEFANQKGIPLRVYHEHNSTENILNIPRSTDYFSPDFYGEPSSVSEALFLSILDKSTKQGYQSIEIMCHPAFIDNDLLMSGYAYQRLTELEVLTGKGFKQAIRDRGYQLATYLDL
ncbi:chitin disaccharide deacetylase [Providencia manganoxydans]|uniref:chitin disaccharide deacetylase n=1 Tax=Providencia manganoxydans TaxID=2923283 RepID=UPI003AF3E6D1